MKLTSISPALDWAINEIRHSTTGSKVAEYSIVTHAICNVVVLFYIL